MMCKAKGEWLFTQVDHSASQQFEVTLITLSVICECASRRAIRRFKVNIHIQLYSFLKAVCLSYSVSVLCVKVWLQSQRHTAPGLFLHRILPQLPQCYISNFCFSVVLVFHCSFLKNSFQTAMSQCFSLQGYLKQQWLGSGTNVLVETYRVRI